MNPREDGPKRDVTATLVKVLVHRRSERGMRLEPHASRCVRAGEVHELVATDHTETAEGARIDRVGFLGFAEITGAGVVDRGDEVWIGPRRVGTVLGFDACHMPNHYNVLVHADPLPTGRDLGLAAGECLVFRQGEPVGADPAAATVSEESGVC
ncbi:hypothetical protein AB0M72_08260 [Nocardiopsis dassonvillei]|uniref:DUF6917 domain-containing protein n=1 Tax=Nocardiopsis dassonvillei TaxID=2014 RepID=UPI00200E408E|nr:hypothetical protein [Nocardiopsis dassonvillei]MCK9868247.1 hypothetical protein [Nocardiopsis dassonvillei]